MQLSNDAELKKPKVMAPDGHRWTQTCKRRGKEAAAAMAVPEGLSRAYFFEEAINSAHREFACTQNE